MRRVVVVVLAALVAAPGFAEGVRPAADIARDAVRKPQEMVVFAKVVPGAKVVDIIAGGGYFTRVFAQAVGPTGKVTAIVPPSAAQLDPASAKAVNELAADTSYGNVAVAPAIDATMNASFDVAWTAQNYHDLHVFLPAAGVAAFNKQVFGALKPGGLYVVLDHAAAAGSGVSVAKTLHRIDPAVVKAEVVAAGFVFEGESRTLLNPADPHTAAIFDPAIRGRTDQFVYRFRKP